MKKISIVIASALMLTMTGCSLNSSPMKTAALDSDLTLEISRNFEISHADTEALFSNQVHYENIWPTAVLSHKDNSIVTITKNLFPVTPESFTTIGYTLVQDTHELLIFAKEKHLEHENGVIDTTQVSSVNIIVLEKDESTHYWELDSKFPIINNESVQNNPHGKEQSNITDSMNTKPAIDFAKFINDRFNFVSQDVKNWEARNFKVSNVSVASRTPGKANPHLFYDSANWSETVTPETPRVVSLKDANDREIIVDYSTNSLTIDDSPVSQVVSTEGLEEGSFVQQIDGELWAGLIVKTGVPINVQGGDSGATAMTVENISVLFKGVFTELEVEDFMKNLKAPDLLRSSSN